MTVSSSAIHAASPDGQLELTADQARITLLPGSRQQIMLSVSNKAASPLAVEVDGRGLPGDWFSLNPTSLQLAPVQTAAIAMALTPPADAPPGDYPLVVLAQITDHPETAARINLTLEIAEAGKLDVTITPAQAEGQVSAEFQVRLAQTGAEALALALAAQDQDNACDYSFDPPSLTLQPNGSAASRLVVRARQGLAGVDSRTITFNVTATATQGAAVVGSSSGRFVQLRALPLQLTLVPAEQRGPDRVAYSVRLTNASQVQATVRLSAADTEQACRFQFDPPSLTIPPSGQAQATLAVVPVQYLSGTGEKVHTFTVLAQPDGQLLPAVQASARFIQTPAAQPVLALQPPAQSKSGAATYTIQVRNPRAQPLDVQLTAYDINGASTFNITPARLQVPPNGAATAQLSVRPSSGLLPNEARRSLSFTVQAQMADSPDPILLQGTLTLVRPSRLGLFLIGVVAALLLGACVGAGLIARSILGANVTPTRPAVALVTTAPQHTAAPIPPTQAPATAQKNIPTQAPDTAVPTSAPLPLSTNAPTVAPNTAAPAPSDTPVPTNTPPPPPTHTFPTSTPSFPPGVYVTALRMVPLPPDPLHPTVHRMDFIATFFNNTGSPQGYVYRVDIFLPDRSKSFGISSPVNISVPVGVSDQQSGEYRITACEQLSARVIHEEGEHKTRVPFVMPNGSDFWFDFNVC